jgi:hypothetical protein
MKKQITVREHSAKTIEVEIPSYYNFHGKYTAITDHAVINVWSGLHMISFILASNVERYNQAIDDVFGLFTIEPCTKEEFDTAFNNTIKCLTEQYQLSMNMLDPKEQTAAEGQEQAVESAAQDTAMEVTESAEATEE